MRGGVGDPDVDLLAGLAAAGDARDEVEVGVGASDGNGVLAGVHHADGVRGVA